MTIHTDRAHREGDPRDVFEHPADWVLIVRDEALRLAGWTPVVVVDGRRHAVWFTRDSPYYRGEGAFGLQPLRYYKPREGYVYRRTLRTSGSDSAPEKFAAAPTPGKGTKVFWIEIELIDQDNEPIPGEPYEVELPDGTKRNGTLDSKGFARIGEIPVGGNCKVTFPNRDKTTWDAA